MWLLPTETFLGGTAGGAFIAYYIYRRAGKYEPLQGTCLYVAFLALLATLFALLFYLMRPAGAVAGYAYRSIPTSTITWGTWLITIFLIVVFIAAIPLGARQFQVVGELVSALRLTKLVDFVGRVWRWLGIIGCMTWGLASWYTRD